MEPQRTVTMVDVVGAIDALEREANVKIDENWGSEGECTYKAGYIDQPVYVCKTCSSKAGKRIGVCFGCSMDCHLEHDIEELFDKRGFRCDCPTSISPHKCSFSPRVDSVNTENVYTHNFDGLYCWCNKPYTQGSNVTMLQCTLCQDWYHEECLKKHYKGTILTSDDDNELICHDCTSKMVFLGKYRDILHPSSLALFPAKKEVPKYNAKRSFVEMSCKVENIELIKLGDIFVKKRWREELCRCDKCCDVYKSHKVMYLLKQEPKDDEGDDEKEHVDLKKSTEEQFDKFMKGMDHVKQMAMARAYEEMKAKLVATLRDKASNNAVVTQEDILNVFGELQENRAAKKRRT